MAERNGTVASFNAARLVDIRPYKHVTFPTAEDHQGTLFAELISPNQWSAISPSAICPGTS